MSLTADTVPDRSAIAVAPPSSWVDRWRRPLLVFVGLELLLLFAPTVVWLFGRWTMSVWHNAHGIFVPPLAGWLAYQELKGRRDLPADPSALGFAFLIPGLMLHAVDAGLHTQLLSAIALFMTIPGLALLLLGQAQVRLIAFPLVFLWFALPVPLTFTEPLQLALRNLAADTTARVLPLLGLGLYREGTTLHTISGIVEVSDACSGFSTLYAALTVAALVAYSTDTWKRAVVVILTAAPLAIAANVLRVIALSLMVALGHAWLLETFVHPLSGMLTFALALPVLFWLGDPPGAERS